MLVWLSFAVMETWSDLEAAVTALQKPSVTAMLEELGRMKEQHGWKIGLTLSGVEQAETLRLAMQVTYGPEKKQLFDCVQVFSSYLSAVNFVGLVLVLRFPL